MVGNRRGVQQVVAATERQKHKNRSNYLLSALVNLNLSLYS